MIELIHSKEQLEQIIIILNEANVFLLKVKLLKFSDILNPNSPKITQVVDEGQLSMIKPVVAHTMVFQKIQLLNLVRGEREHENYGVTHTIKHVFVDEKEKNLL